jgi:hypothetical protein
MFTFELIAQNDGKFTIVSEVNNNEIRLKWFPTNFQDMKALINEGAEITRVEGNIESNSTLFESGIKTKIEPTKIRFTALSKTDSSYSKIEALLQPFYETKQLSNEVKEFAFVMLTLDNSITSKLGEIIGSEFRDKNFEKNKNYTYRIRIKGVKDQFVTIVSQNTEYSKLELKPLLLDQKKAVELNWNAQKTLNEGFGFYIERKDGPTIKSLFETPYVRAVSKDVVKNAPDFYRDETFEEGKSYEYRLVGLNYFGEKKLFSEWVKIQIPTFIHGAMYIDTTYTSEKNRIISGIFDPDSAKVNSVLMYQLYRSEKNQGKYELIQEKKAEGNAIEFKVFEPLTGDRYYYKIAAIRPSEDSIFSNSAYVFTLDQEAPSAPTSLKAIIDSNGIVKLSWIAPPDKDIQGYRIFRANEKREEFIEKTSNLVNGLNFSDTLRLDNLTSECFYFVQATDFNFNTSIHSDTVMVIKPDTIAPIPCIFKTIEIVNNAIQVKWINSNSSDFKNSALIRKTASKVDTLLVWVNPKVSVFVDSNATPGFSYQYKIITFDKSKNKSVSDDRELFFETGYRNPMKGFNCVKTDKTIELTWDKPNFEIYNYSIYRKDNKGNFSLLKTVTSEKLNYSDKNLSIGNEYSYYVQFITKDGIRSLPSKTITIKF